MAFSLFFFCPFGVMVTLKGHNELYSFLLYGKVQREESAKNSLFVFQGENNSFFFFWSILPFSVRLIELKIYLAEHRNVSCVNDP